MSLEPQLILVDSDVVPSVFLKVIKAKQLLSKGVAKNSTEACRIAEISRSAFYKYKDSVFLYEEKSTKKTITLYCKLSDEPGVLSSVLNALYQHKTNVLTVNQNVPVDGAADVTITIRVSQKRLRISALQEDLSNINGMIEVRRI